MPASTPDQPAALVTGAGRRIGRAIAMDLARHGWAVAVHFNASGEAAGETVEAIRGSGGTAAAVQADLADRHAVQGLIPACAHALGALTCLVNNASVFEYDALPDLDGARWQRHLDVNLRAPVFLAQAFAEALPADTGGSIINILDQRVWKLTPDFFSYTISKSALWTATRTMAQALGPRIRVNAVGPGPTLPNPRQTSAGFARQQQATPLRRGPELDEICAAVRFILDASSMTGQMIALDGGQHLSWRTPDVADDGQEPPRQDPRTNE